MASSGLQKPEFAGAGLEIHARELVHKLGFLILVAAHQVGLAVIAVAAGLEIRIGSVEGEFAVAGLVNVVDLQGQEAAFLVQKELGIIGGGLEDRLP